ncbi:PhoX family protein [Kribbia dieselivorans]|uniref:PhoX family protein n=1 Tax=Kribbia dieselivorans TaxID=331526 RepID=UPI000AB1E10C|nr:PhoX family phosphatase [Kribbia dieselivorans]
MKNLPIIHASGGRASMTCIYRCNNQCAHPDPNTSDNEYFGDIVAANASRRSVLKTGGLMVAVGGLAAATSGVLGAEPAAAAPAGKVAKKSPFGFEKLPFVPAATDKVVVPEGFEWSTIIAWGDPLWSDVPAFDVTKQTAAKQARQFGYNNDYVGLFRTKNNNRAVLVVNHEYVNPEFMFSDFTSVDTMSEEQLRITMAAHGMTVVEVERKNPESHWTYVKDAKLNRRIDAHSEFELVGPVRGHALVKTSADPTGSLVLGTVNNCAGGETPWGTVLSGEENFHGYFKPAAAPTAEQKRYGITDPYMPHWFQIEKRWDLNQEPNEVNRFGWVVEIDPMDPTARPKKLTAMGRFKHEGAEAVVAKDGHVVVYSGDDERFEYAYKFVSKGTFITGNDTHNRTLLHEGDLYVAKFTGDGLGDGEHDGTGQWLPLTKDGKSMVAGMSYEEVLLFTRLAADKVGPTKMDRPEDFEPSPVTDSVYMALTNNTRRAPGAIDEANPRPNNKHGHVMEISNTKGHSSDTFNWKIVMLCGDPNDPTTYFNGYDKSQVSAISCPDNVAFDSKGNLWVATDGAPGTLGKCDGMYLFPLEGPEKGHLQQFISVPAGAENCGPFISWDDRTVLTAVQHPGELNGATYSQPASLFPYKGDPVPRPGVIMVKAQNKGKGNNGTAPAKGKATAPGQVTKNK